MAVSSVVDLAAGEIRVGNHGEAEFLLRRHLAEAPWDFDATVTLAGIEVAKGNIGEVASLARRALALRPDAAFIRVELAQLLQRQGLTQEALNLIDAAPSGDFQLFALRAELLGRLGRNAEEIEQCRKMTVSWPANPGIWLNYGNALKKQASRLQDAIAAFREAIRRRSTFGEAWWSLSNLKTVTFGDADIADMKRNIRKCKDDLDLLHFHFALGKAYEDQRKFDLSFHHYASANRIRHDSFPPGMTRITGRVDAAIDTFTPELMESMAGAGCSAADPIFVVGLQRSGSTLIEQILASHPDVEGTGELSTLEQIWGELGPDPFAAIAACTPERLRKLGRLYLDRTRCYRNTDRPRFVDKLPANWLNVGFIRLILPNARIIDARRHPLACGFSNFKQNYATGVAFAYSLESIGFFYRDYVRLMAHFEHLSPGGVHRVINERLIENVEQEVRDLLDFLELPFSPQCLQSHKTERAVNTPSSEQVRRPVNSAGVNAWRNYEKWLDPLKQALGPALSAWDAPPPGFINHCGPLRTNLR